MPEIGFPALVTVLLAAGLLTVAVTLRERDAGLHALAYRGATLGPVVVVGGLLALAVLWRLRRGPARA